MKKEITHTWRFNQAPEEVWNYLTKAELLEQWLMKNDFLPIVGHKFSFHCQHETNCEVLEVSPFTKLSYSWQTNSAETGKPFNSKVEWTLVPNGTGTELQLVHDGFVAIEDYLGHNDGWTKKVGELVELLMTKKEWAH